MKDDLISRTVLQEKNREFFKDCIMKDKFDMDVTECNVAMQELLNNQPTAYEVDKVVEQEPRYMLDKESICYGCPYFKKVEDCGGIPAVDDIICGGACDCANPCFEGSQNDYGLEVEV